MFTTQRSIPTNFFGTDPHTLPKALNVVPCLQQHWSRFSTFLQFQTITFHIGLSHRLSLHRDVSQPLNGISDRKVEILCVCVREREREREKVEWNVSIRLCVLHDGSQGQSGTPITQTTPTNRSRKTLLPALDISSGPDPKTNIFMSKVRNRCSFCGGRSANLTGYFNDNYRTTILPVIPMTIIVRLLLCHKPPRNSREDFQSRLLLSHPRNQMYKYWISAQFPSVVHKPQKWCRVQNAKNSLSLSLSPLLLSLDSLSDSLFLSRQSTVRCVDCKMS
jgi:hypothetical protein